MFKSYLKMSPLLVKRFSIAKRCCSISDKQIDTVSSKKLDILKLLVHKYKFQRSKAEYIIYKCPSILRLNETDLSGIIQAVKQLGMTIDSVGQNPKIFGMTPGPITEHAAILKECGCNKLSLEIVCHYLTLARKCKVSELISRGCIPADHNVVEGLISIFKDWPISRINLSYLDQKSLSLLELRMKVLQRYLELVLDLSAEEFDKALKSYPRIKHRSLNSIKNVFQILQDEVLMPISKIKSNLFLLYCDPENLKMLVYKLKRIAGVDIREVLKAHPVLCNVPYDTFLNTNKVLQFYNISDLAQTKCFEIYSLSTETVRNRLEEASQIPEFKVLFDHPRVLRLIYYRNNAHRRLQELNDSNKKCTSLHILSCSKEHYNAYEKSPGDRTKGKDFIQGFSKQINKPVHLIRKILIRHPFWTNIPLVQAKMVCDNLLQYFNEDEIFNNCVIVLYPWQNIESVLVNIVDGNVSKLIKNEGFPPSLEHLDVSLLSKCQLLSLTLYFLERRHYFSGNGVWLDNRVVESAILEPKKVSSLLKH